ncbi:hypothetical protein BDW02DRAFT_622723 [Decorospora gaudefroyi]|uniref:Uncharacterized protein n=1 Tax=Decorospora gaudefroyi TaxID=184978 RepID=A0A6A5JXG6_9PLEO|nr:hypothetical protein BDW02DRAFT_622723 [Decorospora gaudefroyi]
MQYFTILLGLAASVSAIDIRMRDRGNCNGAFLACRNINPNVCCGSGRQYASVGIVAIPASWSIEGRTYQGGGCTTLTSSSPSAARTNFCMPFVSTGASYRFLNGRRRTIDVGSTEECTSSVKPDSLVLGDEVTTFAIADMEDALIDELMDHAANGLQAADIPEKFKSFQVADRK